MWLMCRCGMGGEFYPMLYRYPTIPPPPQVWLRSLGSCYHRYCWSFSRLGVDGWLLSALNADVMESVLGVDDKRARAAIMGALSRWGECAWSGR